jgi:hypothetical protein
MAIANQGVSKRIFGYQVGSGYQIPKPSQSCLRLLMAYEKPPNG